MTISYPLSPPSNRTPSATRWTEVNIVAVQNSAYTLQSQTYEHSGKGWGVEVSFDPMPRDEAQPWIAFLSALRGRKGTFLFGDTLFSTPLGLAGGTPFTNGANQTGSSLITDGWTINQAILKAGDMFQIDSSLYRNLTDVTSDGSGNATLDVWPSLRAHADNALIVTANPKGTFRLTDNAQVTQSASGDGLYLISFKGEEVL
jgi:hypothetical protein